jgi:Ca-activated chloride channel homolog
MPSRPFFGLVSSTLLFTLFIPTPGLGQTKTTAKSDADLIMMTATVRNSAGDYVMGVPREGFELVDEKEKRAIEYFESSDEPASIGILIDTSASIQFSEVREIGMQKPIGDAITRFLQLGNPGNEYFLMSFDRTSRVVTDWTSAQALLAQRPGIGPLGHNTALYDACFTAVEKFQTANHSKRVLILVSDGQDNLSRHTFNQLRGLLRKSDIVVCAITVGHSIDVGVILNTEGADIMAKIAETTGGEALLAGDAKELGTASEALSIQLRHQYRIGFRAAGKVPPNQWRRLKLRITPLANSAKEFRKLTVRTRRGYYTP